MDFIFGGYAENKIKPYLKMAIERLKLENNKKTNSVKHQKREIADLLGQHKTEKARIKVEHIIRDDFTIEGYEVLELICELVFERIRQITNCEKNECPAELREAVFSLIWASHNVSSEELKTVGSQLTSKFGKPFAKLALENRNGEVNARLFNKLTYKPPSSHLVINYLQEIAKVYQVDWKPDLHSLYSSERGGHGDDGSGGGGLDAPFASPSGSSIPMAPGSGLGSAYVPTLMKLPNNAFVPAMTPEEEREHQEFLKLQARGGAAGLMRPVPGAEKVAPTAPMAPQTSLSFGTPAISRPSPVDYSLAQQQRQRVSDAVPVVASEVENDDYDRSMSIVEAVPMYAAPPPPPVDSSPQLSSNTETTIQPTNEPPTQSQPSASPDPDDFEARLAALSKR